MMYQEITIIPAPEIPVTAVWEKLMPQLHIGLTDVYNQKQIDRIGICFPRYQMGLQRQHNGLGNKLRLIAPDRETLEALNIEQQLERLKDYVHIKSIAPVPENTYPVTVRRYRFRPIEIQAKSLAERYGIEFERAMEHCLTYRKREIFPPFIKIKSYSSGNPFPLVILQENALVENNGVYTTYGLSKQGSTVPMW